MFFNLCLLLVKVCTFLVTASSTFTAFLLFLFGLPIISTIGIPIGLSAVSFSMFLASLLSKLLPILGLFPFKQIPSNILQKYPETWVIGRFDNGWMTCEIFYEYIRNSFNGFLIKENIKKPVMLFLDGHISHRSLPLTTFCKENDVILNSRPLAHGRCDFGPILKECIQKSLKFGIINEWILQCWIMKMP